MYTAHEAFVGAMQEAGVTGVASAQLGNSSAGAIVRGQGADALVTDGPFAEAREQLAGLYVLDCADLDEALALATLVPGSPGLAVEIRPAMS